MLRAIGGAGNIGNIVETTVRNGIFRGRLPRRHPDPDRADESCGTVYAVRDRSRQSGGGQKTGDHFVGVGVELSARNGRKSADTAEALRRLAVAGG